MNRRTYLKSMLAVGAVSVAQAADAAHPIQLHVDLTVEPAKEKEMLKNFHSIFKPAAIKLLSVSVTSSSSMRVKS